MRGASPLTTIHEPPQLLRSIVVRPLAGLMPSLAGTLSGGQVIVPFDLVRENLTPARRKSKLDKHLLLAYTNWLAASYSHAVYSTAGAGCPACTAGPGEVLLHWWAYLPMNIALWWRDRSCR